MHGPGPASSQQLRHQGTHIRFSRAPPGLPPSPEAAALASGNPRRNGAGSRKVLANRPAGQQRGDSGQALGCSRKGPTATRCTSRRQQPGGPARDRMEVMQNNRHTTPARRQDGPGGGDVSPPC